MRMQSWDASMTGGWWGRGLFALVMVFVVFPQVDLGISALFYDPETQRFVTEGPFLNMIRKGVPPILYAVLVFLALVWAGDRLIPGPQSSWPTGRQLGFLALSLALGPGLIVNGILKELWGRARPSDITVFGGHADFTPAWMIADQCATNCAFVSGHAAMGFWGIAFALLAPARWRRLAVVAAVLFGAVVGGARIVVGAHFLSDTVFAAVIVIALTVWLHRQFFWDD